MCKLYLSSDVNYSYVIVRERGIKRSKVTGWADELLLDSRQVREISPSQRPDESLEPFNLVFNKNQIAFPASLLKPPKRKLDYPKVIKRKRSLKLRMHIHGLMLRDRGKFTACIRTLLSDVGVHLTNTFKMFQNLKFCVMNLKFYLQNLKSYLLNLKL